MLARPRLDLRLRVHASRGVAGGATRALALLLSLSAPVPARAAAGGPDTLTVEGCAAEARARAHAVRAARGEERAAGLDSLAASYNRRPDVHLQAGALVAPGGSYDPAITNLGEYHLQAGLDWPLADGGKRRRERERAAVDANAARLERMRTTREAGERAASLALEILRDDEVERVQREAGAALERIGTLVASGVRAGVRSPADSIRLALALESATLDLSATVEAGRSARRDLVEALGRDVGQAPIVLAPPSRAEGPSPEDSLALLAAAKLQPEVTLASLEVARARLDAAEAEGRDALAADLSLDAGLAGSDLTRWVPGALIEGNPDATFADRLRRDLGASVAIDLKLPLFDRARAPSLEAQRARIEAANARLDGALLGQVRELSDRIAGWRAAAARFAIAGAIVERAESHVLRTTSLYAAGSTTLFDVLDALQLRLEARVRLAETRQDVAFTRFQVEDRR